MRELNLTWIPMDTFISDLPRKPRYNDNGNMGHDCHVSHNLLQGTNTPRAQIVPGLDLCTTPDTTLYPYFLSQITFQALPTIVTGWGQGSSP